MTKNKIRQWIINCDVGVGKNQNHFSSQVIMKTEDGTMFDIEQAMGCLKKEFTKRYSYINSDNITIFIIDIKEY